jgi:hypothetical protein
MSRITDGQQLAIALRAAGFIPLEEGYPALLPPDHRLLDRVHSQLEATADLPNLAVEPLLDEAMMLLNRCITARQVKQDLEATAVTTYLSNSWFREGKALRQQLADIGEYSLPHDLAKIDVEALNKAINESTNAASIAKAHADERQENHVDAIERRQLIGELVNITAPIPSPEITRKSSRLAELVSRLERYATVAGWRQLESSTRLVEGAMAAAKRKLEFEQLAGDIRRSLFDKETAYRNKLADLAAERGSPLNYNERLAQLQEMFDVDMLAAYSRLKALQAGADVLYDYDGTPLPDLSNDGALSSLVVWTRKFAEHIARVHERTQICTSWVSIRKGMPSGEWKALLTGGKISLTIGTDMWPTDTKLIRLREISLGIDGASPNLKMAVTARIPKIARFVTLSGKAKSFDYGFVPTLYLGDVSALSNPTQFGRASSRMTYNASPLGDWHFDVNVPAESLDMINDLKLGISAAVIMGDAP